MAYRFVVCELVSGNVIDELPLMPENELTRLLKGYGAGTLDLHLADPSTPANWENLMQPWRVLVLAVDPAGAIAWAGVPTDVQRTLSPVVKFPCVTLENYLSRRYVPELSFSGQDQTSVIAKQLVQSTDAGGIGLLYDCPASGVTRDRNYHADEDARVFTRLQELSSVSGGFEWTIDVAWSDTTQTAVTKTFRTGYPTLGNVTSTPDHVFELPGSVVDFNYSTPWTDTNASTYTVATGDGQGAARTISAPVIDTTRESGGWPRLEEHQNFSGVKDQTTINLHASAMAKQLFGGQQIITLTSRANGTPALSELTLGDSARVRIITPQLNLDTIFRVVGWALTANSDEYKPTLARIG